MPVKALKGFIQECAQTVLPASCRYHLSISMVQLITDSLSSFHGNRGLKRKWTLVHFFFSYLSM